MITTNLQLNEQQLKDLKQLATACKDIDGSTPNLYMHLLAQQRSLPANNLYYENERLIGFLSYYFFYEDAVEVALLVHPSFRRNEVARQLIHSILPILKSYNVKRLIFTSPAKKNATWLMGHGFTYLHSEYNMLRNELSPLLNYNHYLTFRNANTDDISILYALDEACFPKKQVESADHFQNLLNDRNYEVIIASQNNNPIGKAHIRWESNGVTLSDIAIHPDFQGKGFGTSLIAHCINLALSNGKVPISLDVETHNQRALNLYTRLGFLIQNASDYWEINIFQLSKLNLGSVDETLK